MPESYQDEKTGFHVFTYDDLDARFKACRGKTLGHLRRGLLALDEPRLWGSYQDEATKTNVIAYEGGAGALNPFCVSCPEDLDVMGAFLAVFR